MMELMTALTNRLDVLTAVPDSQTKQAQPPVVHQGQPCPKPSLQMPQSSVLPPFQPVPKSLAGVLGAPPPVRAQPVAAAEQTDLNAQMARGIGEEELPGEEPPQESSLASAVMAQSQALVALVSQMFQESADPLLEIQPGASSSVRGSVGRAKLQQELLARTGSFAQTIRSNMLRRMDPTGLVTPNQVSFTRYLEKKGRLCIPADLGVGGMADGASARSLRSGPAQWGQGHPEPSSAHAGSSSTVRGDITLEWLLTLQAEPPLGLFQQPSVLAGWLISSDFPFFLYVRALLLIPESVTRRDIQKYTKKAQDTKYQNKRTRASTTASPMSLAASLLYCSQHNQLMWSSQILCAETTWFR